MVAREDAQMVSWLVSQAVLVICVQPYENGGTTAETRKPFGEAVPFCARCHDVRTMLTSNGADRLSDPTYLDFGLCKF